MLKGITKSGFDYEIEDKALDNWELLESLVAIDEGDTAAVIKVARQLLSKAQLDSLKEHCRDIDTGIVSRNKMLAEIADILKGEGSEGDKTKKRLRAVCGLAHMICRDEMSLACDLAEVYHIYDYKTLPLSSVAAFFMGLRPDSRCKMLLSGDKVTLDTLLAAMIYDKLAWLQWAKTKDGARGVNIPETVVSKLLGDSESKTRGFTSIEEFEKARQELIGGET